MTDISPRRRLTGRAAIVSAFMAVPLTASIYFADDEASTWVASAQAAEVDEWTPTDVPQEQDETAEVDMDVDVEQEFDEAERDLQRAERELDEAEQKIVHIEREIERGENGKLIKRHVRYNGKNWEEMSEGERAKFREEMADLRERLADDGEMRREIRRAVAEARAEALTSAPQVVMQCKDRDNFIRTEEGSDGRITMFVCEANAEKLAINALRTARSAIAAERNLTSEQRVEALRSLEQELARLEAES